MLSGVAKAQPVEIKIPAPYSDKDIAHQYYIGLAKMALRYADAGATFELVETMHMNQARAVKELQKGNLDLFWIGTDSTLEQQLRAIPIPLDKGLMGFRRFIILKKNKPVFDRITTLKQLKQHVACQGRHWIDTNVLKAAGLPVLDSPVHADLFELLAAERCDYFPRGLHEGLAEVEQYREQYPEFMVSDRIILHYPFTVYFFTTRENETLARQIESGLEKMIDEGQLMRYMRSHPSMSRVFPLRQFAGATIISLPNPALPADTPVSDPRYWLKSKILTQPR